MSDIYIDQSGRVVEIVALSDRSRPQRITFRDYACMQCIYKRFPLQPPTEFHCLKERPIGASVNLCRGHHKYYKKVATYE